jgi:hypothetical protein
MADSTRRSEFLWQSSVLIAAAVGVICFYRRPAELPLPEYSQAAVQCALANDRKVMVVIRGWDAVSGFAMCYTARDPVASLIERKNVLVLQADLEDQQALLRSLPPTAVTVPMIFVYKPRHRYPVLVDIGDIGESAQAIVAALED